MRTVVTDNASNMVKAICVLFDVGELGVGDGHHLKRYNYSNMSVS